MWRVRATIKDGENHKADVTVHLPSATTYAQATGFATAWGAALGGFPFNGTIVAFAVEQDLALPAQGSLVADPDSEVELKALFGFRTADGHAYSFSVPTIDKPAAILPNSDLVDMGNTDVSDLTDIYVTGVDVSGTFIKPVDTRGQLLSALESAVEAYGKKRKSGKKRLHVP